MNLKIADLTTEQLNARKDFLTGELQEINTELENRKKKPKNRIKGIKTA
jgi:hypothetical protein